MSTWKKKTGREKRLSPRPSDEDLFKAIPVIENMCAAIVQYADYTPPDDNAAIMDVIMSVFGGKNPAGIDSCAGHQPSLTERLIKQDKAGLSNKLETLALHADKIADEVIRRFGEGTIKQKKAETILGQVIPLRAMIAGMPADISAIEKRAYAAGVSGIKESYEQYHGKDSSSTSSITELLNRAMIHIAR